MNGLVLIADDDRDLADALGALLRREGFRTAWAADGEAAAALHATLRPDLVLLDLDLPVRDGWDVLGELRRRGQTPALVTTRHDKPGARLQAFAIGADDYLVKPFDPAEAVARVRSALARLAAPGQDRLRIGPLEIDLAAYVVDHVGPDGRRRLTLTLTEFRLLAHMARPPLRAFSRADLAAACGLRPQTRDRTIDSHLRNLRHKLRAAGVDGLVVSVHGVGYRVEPGA